MIVYIVIVLAAGVAYYSLLSKYSELWSDVAELADCNTQSFSVTILIPFRNEIKNLLTLLDSLEHLETAEHSVQVICINDHSTDGGEQLIENYQGKLDIRLIHQTERSGKTAAIRLGWEQCTSEIILQMDADCILPAHWLRAMLSVFNNSVINLACGPVQFHHSANFWKRIVALDFEALIAIGAAHIQWGKPMICNAANLGYRRSLVSVADLNDSTASGDDVFLLQSAYLKDVDSILFVKNKEAIVRTIGPSSFSSFWHQRLRSASKDVDYESKQNTWIPDAYTHFRHHDTPEHLV